MSHAIMAHPSRKGWVRHLQRSLPRAEVVWDREGSRWETGRRALLAFDPSADAHCVTQDDAILCRRYAASVKLVAQTDRPVSLYVGKVRPHQRTVQPAVRKARQRKTPWLAMRGPLWGVALIIPTPHIPELVEWCDRQDIPNYDRRIGAWYEQQGIACWYTLPSLVDHRSVSENPSLVTGRNGNRQAHWFIGTDHSAEEVDWTRRPLILNGVAEFIHKNTQLEQTALRNTAHYQRLRRSPMWEERTAA